MTKAERRQQKSAENFYKPSQNGRHTPIKSTPTEREILERALEDEIADLQGALDFMIEKMKLDAKRIAHRKQTKLIVFHVWDETED